MKMSYRFLVVTSVIITQIAISQWEQTNGPYGGMISCLAASTSGDGNSNIFAGTYHGGVFRSTDNGLSWKAMNSGLKSNIPEMITQEYVTSLLVLRNGDVFAAFNGGGVFLSTNNGASWNRTGFPNGSYPYSLAQSDTHLFAGTGNGLYISSDNGATWFENTAGAPKAPYWCFVSSGKHLFAGSDHQYGSLFLSTDNGINWTIDSTGLMNNDVLSLAAVDSNIIAGTRNGVFVSTNNGVNWTATSMNTGYISSLAVFDSTIFATVNGGGVYRSTDNGATWSAVNNGLTELHVLSLVESGKGDSVELFVGTWQGVFRSTNIGASWTAANRGLTNCDVRAFAVLGDNIFVGTSMLGVFLSIDDGNNFTPVNSSLNNAFGYHVFSLAVSGTTLYAGTNDGVYFTTNNGINWVAVNTGFHSWTQVTALAVMGTKLFAGTTGGLFSSTNNGASWTIDTVGMSIRQVYVLYVSDTNIFAGTDRGLFRSTNGGTIWTPINNGLTNDIHAFGICEHNYFAGGSSGLFRSTDNGASWVCVSNGLGHYSNASISALAVSGTKLFIAGYSDGIYLSTNNGANWTEVDSGLTTTFLKSLTIHGRYLYAGTEGSSIWRRPLSEMITGPNYALQFDGIDDYVMTTKSITQPGTLTILLSFKTASSIGGVLIGANQNQDGSGGKGERRIYMNSAGQVYFGVYSSGVQAIHSAGSYNDNKWHHVAAELTPDGMKLFIDSNLVASNSVTTDEIIYSNYWILGYTDMISDWPSRPSNFHFNGTIDAVSIWNTALTQNQINTFARTPPAGHESSLLYDWPFNEGSGTSTGDACGNGNNGILVNGTAWVLSSSGNPASVPMFHGNNLPGNYVLRQNYPNPFNPSTTICYAIPPNPSPGGRGAGVRVKLTILDILGREIATLVNEEQTAGWKELVWNGSNVSSGIYFYSLQADNFNQVKKMVLFK